MRINAPALTAGFKSFRLAVHCAATVLSRATGGNAPALVVQRLLKGLSVGALSLTLYVGLTSEAAGDVLSWTGAELVSAPNVSLPTTAPTVVGSSIIFGPGAEEFGKLIEIPLIPAGFFTAASPPASISMSINITRLTGDWDPHFMLGDGSNLIGAVVSDIGSSGGPGGVTRIDQGTTAPRGTDDGTLFVDAAFPSVGGAIDVNVQWELMPALTRVTVSYGSSSGSITYVLLDRTKALSFILLRDNDLGEQYQVNTLSVTTPVAPVPDTTPPVLTLPSSFAVDATSPAGAIVNYTVTATDTSGVEPTVSCNPPSGATFAIGPTTVKCTATDAASNSATGSFVVTVSGAEAQLLNLVSMVGVLGSPWGITNSLDTKLQNAINALNAMKNGGTMRACSPLRAFVNEVLAQSDKKLTLGQSNVLIGSAMQIQAVLSCP